jgi:hypothetical protein
MYFPHTIHGGLKRRKTCYCLLRLLTSAEFEVIEVARGQLLYNFVQIGSHASRNPLSITNFGRCHASLGPLSNLQVGWGRALPLIDPPRLTLFVPNTSNKIHVLVCSAFHRHPTTSVWQGKLLIISLQIWPPEKFGSITQEYNLFSYIHPLRLFFSRITILFDHHLICTHSICF